MIKKTITYDSYDGESITEDFYFNLSKAEMIELQYGTEGGYGEMLEGIIKSKKQHEIISILREFIKNSVGQKSLDGKLFVKNADITNAFMMSEAYTELIVELFGSSEFASEFINGLFPKGTAEFIAAQQTSDEKPAWMLEDRDPTQAELVTMPQSEMIMAFQYREARLKAKIDTSLAPVPISEAL